MRAKISDYFSLVKFSHTIFAMPFALLSYTCAIMLTDCAFDWVVLIKMILCMVFARNVAMGFNRYIDRDVDAKNPRTASREIPAGVISPKVALRLIVINGILFFLTASSINMLTACLSPVALGVLIFYSYCKRFTAFSHLVLGLSLGIAPVGAWIAVTGSFALVPCILSLVVIFWCAGFDVIYALQDRDFDIKNGLHSIPASFSVRTSLLISIVMHMISVASIVWFAVEISGGVLLWLGVVLFACILASEHIIVTPKRQLNIPIAFGTFNAMASVELALLAMADILFF
ncbi:MAG: putative 4-hydroxybenzoate polyprenyltransferase [Alistipes sp.]|nr:putative 4-hydroxybenzoate polyprenyltransferase [Candidatus Alistipes equi]